MNEKMYHIGLDENDVCSAKYAILPGDPGRVPKIAALLGSPRKIGQNREYTSYLGTLAGQNVLVMSTGMGGPSTAIGVEELHKLGFTTLIRVGTCGGMQLDVMPGDLVVVNAAIRMEGTSREYLPIEFPAVSNFDVTNALAASAAAHNYPYHVGVAHCKDSFYGQHDPERMPVGYDLMNKWNAWIKGGALASEMETAALFSVASCLGMRAGGIMLCVWNQERRKAGLDQEETHDTERAIATAIGAAERLISAEQA